LPCVWSAHLLNNPVTEAAPADDAEIAELAASSTHRALQARANLAIREVDAGSCNGCELEIHALNNAFYDIERFGLKFVASPRCRCSARHGAGVEEHAPGLLRTQRYTRPKWVVAVGAPPMAGSSPRATRRAASNVVPVDSISQAAHPLQPRCSRA
jgi:Ni,Fe-hydrogenase III small subunit